MSKAENVSEDQSKNKAVQEQIKRLRRIIENLTPDELEVLKHIGEDKIDVKPHTGLQSYSLREKPKNPYELPHYIK
jgi:hypothetical protein